MKLPNADTMQDTLDRLRSEVEELRASRERLVLAADADRQRIERDLHDGPQQRLVALSVSLQLAGQLAGADPAAARALLHEIGRDVQEALGELAELAQRIYPPLLGAGGLAVSLREAAATVGVPTRVEVAAGEVRHPVGAAAVYFCFVELLEHAGEGTQAAVTVRDDDGALVFEIAQEGAGSEAPPSTAVIGGWRDRVEALGGRLTARTEPRTGLRVSGSIPAREDVSRSRPGT